MIETTCEEEIIEKLNTAPTVRGFFIAAVDVFSDSIDNLIKKVFRRDEFEVKTVVTRLLNESGPLNDLSNRLKFLFGLGVLPDDIYHDIEDIISLRNNLNQDAKQYKFTDINVINSLKKLRLVNKSNVIPFEQLDSNEDISDEFLQIQHQRQRQIIKSGLSLAIIDICVQLNSYEAK